MPPSLLYTLLFSESPPHLLKINFHGNLTIDDPTVALNFNFPKDIIISGSKHQNPRTRGRNQTRKPRMHHLYPEGGGFRIEAGEVSCRLNRRGWVWVLRPRPVEKRSPSNKWSVCRLTVISHKGLQKGIQTTILLVITKPLHSVWKLGLHGSCYH